VQSDWSVFETPPAGTLTRFCRVYPAAGLMTRYLTPTERYYRMSRRLSRGRVNGSWSPRVLEITAASSDGSPRQRLIRKTLAPFREKRFKQSHPFIRQHLALSS